MMLTFPARETRSKSSAKLTTGIVNGGISKDHKTNNNITRARISPSTRFDDAALDNSFEGKIHLN